MKEQSLLVTKRIFISADHGMAIIYFLQSDVIPTLLDVGKMSARPADNSKGIVSGT